MFPRQGSTPAALAQGQQAAPPDRWQLAERVCASARFRRSSRHQELLRYLCRRAWDEGAPEIKEQEIGVAIFQRHPQFDSSQDTLVRVQASQLRKRLEGYFSEEGGAEPWILEIPRGSYAPVVRLRVTPDPVSPPSLPAAEPHARRWLVPALSVLCLFLAAACLFLISRKDPGTTEGGPSVRRFWSAFSANRRETFVVLADSALAAIQDVLGRPIGLDEYLRRGYQQELSRPDLPPANADLLRYLMSRRYTSLADVMLVRKISQARLLDPGRTSVIFSRDHNVRAFHNANHILIGSQRAIPWVHLFEEMMDFHIADSPADFHLHQDSDQARHRVENLRPANGEPAEFSGPTHNPSGAIGYSLIAFLPNLGRNGHTLILAGTDMSGTEAAGNLLTNEEFLRDLLRHLPPKHDGSLPHFEVLLKTLQVESTNRGFEIVALHLH